MDPATGLVRTESRPSDDNVDVRRGYFHVPDNFFVAAELSRVGETLGALRRAGPEAHGGAYFASSAASSALQVRTDGAARLEQEDAALASR